MAQSFLWPCNRSKQQPRACSDNHRQDYIIQSNYPDQIDESPPQTKKESLEVNTNNDGAFVISGGPGTSLHIEQMKSRITPTNHLRKYGSYTILRSQISFTIPTRKLP